MSWPVMISTDFSTKILLQEFIILRDRYTSQYRILSALPDQSGLPLYSADLSPSQWWKLNKAHMDLQKSSRRCLNIVTASAGCKEIMTQSRFRCSDVSSTCVMILRGRESLYCYLCAMKSLRWLAEDISRCLSVMWICCSCIMSKAHFFTLRLGS